MQGAYPCHCRSGELRAARTVSKKGLCHPWKDICKIGDDVILVQVDLGELRNHPLSIGGQLCYNHLEICRRGGLRGEKGMRCIYCGHHESKVVDSRPLDDGVSTRRRRECFKMRAAFHHLREGGAGARHGRKKMAAGRPLMWIRLKREFAKACEKRNVSMDTIDAMALEIENQVQNRVEQEVRAEDIGDMVMEALKKVDEVAYVRFASVYRGV